MGGIIKTLEIASQTFAEIKSRFPHLQCVTDENPNVDLSITFPVQAGLTYAINLHLQNGDELHLAVSDFQLGWFPCTDKSVVIDFIQSAICFMAGEYRILKFMRGEKLVKAQLQKPDGDKWKTIGTYSRSLIPWPRPTAVVIQISDPIIRGAAIPAG